MAGAVHIAPPQDVAGHEAIWGLFVEYSRPLGFSLDYQDFGAELADRRASMARPWAPRSWFGWPALLRGPLRFGNSTRETAR